MYTTVGAIVAGIRLLPGQIVMLSASARAEEMVRWARHHKEVMEWLEKIVEGNDGFNVLVGHAAMMFAILVSVDRIQLGPKSTALLQATGYEELVKLKVQEQGGEVDDRQAVAA